MFCGIVRQIHQLQFSKDSEMNMKEIRQMCKASKFGTQRLNTLTVTVTLKTLKVKNTEGKDN